jgi:hypothetical protein
VINETQEDQEEGGSRCNNRPEQKIFLIHEVMVVAAVSFERFYIVILMVFIL